MVAIARPQPLSARLRLPLPLVGAAASGGVVALAFLLVPADLLESAVVRSGIPALLAAAEPPLGFTARIALGLAFGGLVAAFAWFGLHLMAGDRPFDMSRLTRLLRRPPTAAEAPPRPPLFANRDLGTPFLDVKAPAVPVERDLPADLDQPLAAFDPGALLEVPLPAPEPVAAMAQPQPIRPQLIDPGDRFETFELTPVQREWPPAPQPLRASAKPLSLRVPPPNSLRATPLREAAPEPPPVVTPATESTVHALLARLERGVGVRPAPMPIPSPTVRPGSLEGALGDLRRLATGTR